MGELVKIDGADSHLEISALAETVTARYPGAEPALLFDNIPGYPKGWRILSGAANSFRRLAHVYGFPEPRGRMDIVRAYKARLKTEFKMTPPVMVETGPVLENVWRDDEVDLTKFPAPFVHELDGGRYIGTEDVVIMRHPDTGWVNAGTYRIAVHSKNTVGIWISPGKNGRLIREKYFAPAAKPCPVVISCGQDPDPVPVGQCGNGRGRLRIRLCRRPARPALRDGQERALRPAVPRASTRSCSRA